MNSQDSGNPLESEAPRPDAAKRPIILCFVAYYLPGYRSGGPVRTIANFVDHLGDDFDIRIVTRDRDALDTEPYPDVRVDDWNPVGKAQAFYASRRALSLPHIAGLLRQTPHDLLYLNSFFAFRFTTLPLLARRLGLAPCEPCVIAPRGEFSQGAMALKAWKKRPYAMLSRRLGLYRGLHWQASSDFEAADIQREVNVPAATITVAPNLPPAMSPSMDQPTERKPGPLRLVFLSRISPMKNLDFLLRVLQQVKRDIQLDIYGVIDDDAHWLECDSIIRNMPSNVVVSNHGAIPHEQVAQTLAQYHLFVLPTLGENYGHAIAESISQGTPVLISDRTPWRDLDIHNTGWDISLTKPDRFVEIIEQVSDMDAKTYLSLRKSTVAYARERLTDQRIIQVNQALMRSVLGAVS